VLCCTVLYFTFIGCFASNKYELAIEFSGIVRTVPLTASSGSGNVPSTGNVLHRSYVPSKDSIVNFNIPDYHSEDKITLRVIRHSVCARQVISEKRECLRTFFQINNNDTVKNSGKRSKQGRESTHYKYGWNSVKFSIPSVKTATIETEKRRKKSFLSNLPRWSSLPPSGALPLSPPSCSPSSPSSPSSSSVSASDCIPSSSKSRRNIFNTEEKVVRNTTESNRTDSRLIGESSGVSCTIPNKLNSIREDRMEVLVPEIEVFLWTRFVPFRACLCLQDTCSFDFMHERNEGGHSHGNSNSDTNGTDDYNGNNNDNYDGEESEDEKDITRLDNENENEDGENSDNIVEMNSDKYDDIGRGGSRGRSRNRKDENVDVNSNSDDDYVIDGIEGGMECSEQGSEQGRERGRERSREGPGVSTKGGKLHGNEQQSSLTISPIDNAFNTSTTSTSTSLSIKHSSVCDRQSEFHFLVAHGGVVVVNMIMSALAEKAYLRAALFLTDSNCYNALDIALSRGEYYVKLLQIFLHFLFNVILLLLNCYIIL
jgi:hypothetical protein